MINRVRLEMARHGLHHTMYKAAWKTVNKFVFLKVLRGVTIASCDPQFLQLPPDYVSRFLSRDELAMYATDPANELDVVFIAAALSKGDTCLAVLQGNELASYGWYSTTPTPIEPSDLLLRFSPEYAYMYKGYTAVRHRGKRLHAIGMAQALRHFLDRGYRGLVSYIEANNFDSLKSSFRMGYAPFGSIYIGKVFDRYFIHASSGCRRYAFELRPHKGRSAVAVSKAA
jgi:hypothetical protein